MAGTVSITRALLPALTLVATPPLLLLAVQLMRPAWLGTVWPWLLILVVVIAGGRVFGRFLYRRAERVGEQLLAASRGEAEVPPFEGQPGPVQQALTTILKNHQASERALRASEQRFQLALEASDAHLWEHCLRTGDLTFDASIGRLILGVDNFNSDLSLAEYMATLHPDDLERVRRSSDEFYRSGEFICEYRVRHATRGYIWMRCRGRVMERADDGTPLRAFGTVCDITDLKQIEERLQAALIVAQDANHTRAQFLAGISHELRTPLNGVLGYTQLLLREAEPGTEQRQHLETIERCGLHLLQLINDIIDLSQIDSGRIELREVECDLYALLENSAQVAREQAEASKLQVSVELDANLPAQVVIDELKLRQILLNLLNNAVRFTERGKVALRVHRAVQSTAALQFEVQDTGIGITPERLSGLFDPFRNLANDTGRDDIGDRGFGLAVSQRLCQMMGGEIEVSSAVGVGSCFRFTLPYRSAEPVARALAITESSADQPALAAAPSCEPLRQLPDSALMPLRSALALGDLEGLRSALAALRQHVPAAQSLIDHCNTLLEGFELDRIRELFEDLPGRV